MRLRLPTVVAALVLQREEIVLACTRLTAVLEINYCT